MLRLQLRPFFENFRPLGGQHIAPALESRLRGFNRAFRIRAVHVRHGADNLFGGGIVDVDGFAARRRHPLPVNKSPLAEEIRILQLQRGDDIDFLGGLGHDTLQEFGTITQINRCS